MMILSCKQETIFLITILLGFGMSMGCGSLSAPDGGTRLADNSLFSTTGDPPTTDGLDNSLGTFDCPAEPNVLPDNDMFGDGTGQFTVCQGNTNPFDISISGTTDETKTICVFPAQVLGPQQIFIKRNLQTGGVLSQCLTASDATVATFPGVEYNAVFITEFTYASQLAFCLNLGDYFFCPKDPGYFSFGQFKD